MKTIVGLLISMCFLLISVNTYSQTKEKTKAESKNESTVSKKATPMVQQKQNEKVVVKSNTAGNNNTAVKSSDGNVGNKPKNVANTKAVRKGTKKVATTTNKKE